MLANFKKNTKDRQDDEHVDEEDPSGFGLSQQPKISNNFEEPVNKANFNISKYGFNQPKTEESQQMTIKCYEPSSGQTGDIHS